MDSEFGSDDPGGLDEAEPIDPDALYSLVLGLATPWAAVLTGRLVESNRLRGIRLFTVMTQLPALLPAFEEIVRYTSDLERHFCGNPQLAGLSPLVRRFRDDVEISVEALLGGRHQVLADSMRDAMEVELLFQDFAFDLARAAEWLSCDDETRRREYSPARVRRRAAEALHPGEDVEVPDAREYAAHSEGLHVTPYEPPSGGKALAEGSDAGELLFRSGEILEHSRRFFGASIALLRAAGENEESGILDRPLPAALAAWRDWTDQVTEIRAQIPGDVLPPRGPRPRPARARSSSRPSAPATGG